jgi:hypothetical protein
MTKYILIVDGDKLMHRSVSFSLDQADYDHTLL